MKNCIVCFSVLFVIGLFARSAPAIPNDSFDRLESYSRTEAPVDNSYQWFRVFGGTLTDPVGSAASGGTMTWGPSGNNTICSYFVPAGSQIVIPEGEKLTCTINFKADDADDADGGAFRIGIFNSNSTEQDNYYYTGDNQGLNNALSKGYTGYLISYNPVAGTLGGLYERNGSATNLMVSGKVAVTGSSTTTGSPLPLVDGTDYTFKTELTRSVADQLDVVMSMYPTADPDSAMVTTYSDTDSPYIAFDSLGFYKQNNNQYTFYDVSISTINPEPYKVTVPTGDVTLSWNNIDPNSESDTVTVDVYLGKDPNEASATYDLGTPVITGKDVTGEARSNSGPLGAPDVGTYYWKIVSYINGTEAGQSSMFEFYTTSDLPPTVDAGADIVTWLEAGTVDVTIDATVTDEGTPDLSWTSDGDPLDIGFSDTTIEDPIVTITKAGTS